MLELSTLMKHYAKKAVQEELIANSGNREVAVRYPNGGFGKRPDVLQYPEDILEMVRQGASSFHASEERWQNPLLLKTEMSKKELDAQRIGWDLVLDIDCNFVEYSKIAAHVLVEALKYHDISHYSVKFSGRAGFHIAVPWEAFPSTVAGKDAKLLFPEGTRVVAKYLADFIKKPLAAKILEFEPLDKIKEKTGKPHAELVKGDEFDPFSVLSIDSVLISSRHLYRMPYAFNEKSGLVSIPIHPKNILKFSLLQAKPENVFVDRKLRFLDTENVIPNEAKKLLVQAFDYNAKKVVSEEQKKAVAEAEKEYEIPEEAVPESRFPPCIKLILNGLADGRKRALFILVNFLHSVGWSYEQIEARLIEWNKNNTGPSPLLDRDVVGRVRYSKQKQSNVLPPNCDNKTYYVDIGVCKPDFICKRIKNPVTYTRRALFNAQQNEKQQKKQAKPKRVKVVKPAQQEEKFEAKPVDSAQSSKSAQSKPL